MDLEKKIKERLDNVKLHGWQTLDLRNCSLSEIPAEVYDYTDLVTIDFSNDSFCDEPHRNRIKIVPSEISKLKKLKRLNLSNHY